MIFPLGISFIMLLFVARITLSPIMTSGRITLLAPMKTLSPITAFPILALFKKFPVDSSWPGTYTSFAKVTLFSANRSYQ